MRPRAREVGVCTMEAQLKVAEFGSLGAGRRRDPQVSLEGRHGKALFTPLESLIF